LAKSRPIVVISISDAPSGQWLNIALPLWHFDAVQGGGVHPINLRATAPAVRGPLQASRLPLPQERGVAGASLCRLQHAQGDGGRRARAVGQLEEIVGGAFGSPLGLEMLIPMPGLTAR
jgi:hypothetical protein